MSGWWRSIGAFRRTISYCVPQLPLTMPTETMPQRIAALSGILLLHSPGSHLDVTCNEYQESDSIMDVMNLISEIQDILLVYISHWHKCVYILVSQCLGADLTSFCVMQAARCHSFCRSGRPPLMRVLPGRLEPLHLGVPKVGTCSDFCLQCASVTQSLPFKSTPCKDHFIPTHGTDALWDAPFRKSSHGVIMTSLCQISNATNMRVNNR